MDVGGGERGVYGAGVLDRCMEMGVRFDCCVGVSAGAANLVSYMAGQKGRNFAFYYEYSFRKQYMSPGLLAKTGSYVDLEYIYGTLSNSDGEYPLDWQAMVDSGITLSVVAADAMTGRPVYFPMDVMSQDDYSAVKASSALPLACKPYPVDGRLCFDGGIADPVPVNHAFSLGCDRVVLVLTRPLSSRRDPKKDALGARMLARSYPRAAEALANRADLYNFEVDQAKRYQEEGKLLIVAPDDIGKMDTLTKDKSAIADLYAKGYADAAAIESFVRS
ncbi:MAG: patatin family protein [Eggerthellaceae bacterium]|nr:patatin family protein [Eggerthellaceae bacterium]